jgi:phage terminase large subunit-like protein
MSSQIERLKRDPVAFVQEVLIDPETGRPFRLYPVQERFLREALKRGPDGRLLYPELVFSAPKKSGKTGFAAMIVLYMIVAIGGPYAEGYCVANDFEQAQARVFQAIRRIIQASPMLRSSAKITANRIEFRSTGATITAIAKDYAGAAGANPTIVVFDELWAYSSEFAHRLWDELVPVPTRMLSLRLTVTYAGFEGESRVLQELYHRGIRGEIVEPALYRQPGLLMFWSHEPVAPWQTTAWLEQMGQQLRANAYLRLIENRWVSSESSFVDLAWWDACVEPEARPVITDKQLAVWVGVDASVKRDSTAIVVCTWDRKRKAVRLVWHRVFQPTPDEPLDFEATIEKTLLELRQRFDVREVRFDPFQMQSVAQRLRRSGLRMNEFPQTTSNLTEASTALYELIKGRNLIAYSDGELRLSMNHAVALETPRGWRIAKDKASHRIDVIVALAQAAFAAVHGGQSGLEWLWEYYERDLAHSNQELCAKCRRPFEPGAPYHQARGQQFCSLLCSF